MVRLKTQRSGKAYVEAPVGVGKCTAFHPSENTYGREDNKQEVDRMTASGHQQPLSRLGTMWT